MMNFDLLSFVYVTLFFFLSHHHANIMKIIMVMQSNEFLSHPKPN